MAEAPRATSRRRFLLAAGALAVVATPLAGLYVYRRRRPSPIAKALRSRLPYLHFSDEVIEAFARDHTAALPGIDPVTPNLHVIFLLSTDFFQNAEKEERQLAYVAYPNPYTSPCSNPFAQLA